MYQWVALGRDVDVGGRAAVDLEAGVPDARTADDRHAAPIGGAVDVRTGDGDVVTGRTVL